MSFKKTLLTAGLVAASMTANAMPITGAFEFQASAIQVDTLPTDGIFDAIDFGDATIAADGTIDNDSSRATVLEDVTGTFKNVFGTTAFVNGLTFGSTLWVKDITVGTPATNNPLWTLEVNNGGLIGSVVFNALTASIVDGANPLDMLVTGEMDFIADASCASIYCNYFTTTDATWYVAHNGASNVTASVVTEPGSLALLGLGLAGLGFARRKQAKA